MTLTWKKKSGWPDWNSWPSIPLSVSSLCHGYKGIGDANTLSSPCVPCVFLTYICSCFQNHTFHSLFSFCHSLWESWVCGAHGCWLTPQHLFPSLIPIWSSAVPGTPTPRDSTFCSISCCVCFGLSFIFTVECWGFQGLLSSARSGPHYPNLISFSSAHDFHHLPPSSSASSLFLEYAGEVPTLPPSISLNKTCEGPDGVEHFSLNPSFFFTQKEHSSKIRSILSIHY